LVAVNPASVNKMNPQNITSVECFLSFCHYTETSKLNFDGNMEGEASWNTPYKKKTVYVLHV